MVGVGWVVGTTALFKRLDSFQTATKVQKHSVQECVWRLLFCSQNSEITWLTSLAFTARSMRVSGWMDGSVWMAASVL